MSPQDSTTQIIEGPSVRQLEASSRYPDAMITKPVRFKVTRSVTQQNEPVDGWVEWLVPTKPVEDRCRWFIRLRVVDHQLLELGSPRYRYYYYDSRRREGFELRPDHPLCQLGQMTDR